jgi:hypothetical protein
MVTPVPLKSPRRRASGARLRMRVGELFTREVCSQLAKKKSLSLISGPPRLPPYWLRVSLGFLGVVWKKLRALRSLSVV